MTYKTSGIRDEYKKLRKMLYMHALRATVVAVVLVITIEKDYGLRQFIHTTAGVVTGVFIGYILIAAYMMRYIKNGEVNE